MEKVRNFARFAQFPWASQCVNMARTTGCRHSMYDESKLGYLVAKGKFDDALQKCASVGFWADSIQGNDYWNLIFDGTLWD